MHYLALAADYDGTLAHEGVVAAEIVTMLRKVAATGRQLILVTGRELPELLQIFPQIDIFDLAVVENGAVLYDPGSRKSRTLADLPPVEFIERLRQRQVTPLSIGSSIVATTHPHEGTVLEIIRELGLELQVIFNKGAVMVLPAGVNKASGLRAALEELSLSTHNVVAIGDAENDHALLTSVEYSAAVGNAVPMLKKAADWVLKGDNGTGAAELMRELIETDLAGRGPLRRYQLVLGRCDGEQITIPPTGGNMLVAGSSGAGKSTLCTALIEQLIDYGYQVCVIDPEGDYQDLEHCVSFGDGSRPPGIEEILAALEKPDVNVVVNLLALGLPDRPGYFLALLPGIQALRAQKGRPHVVVIDETHHLLPAEWQMPKTIMPREMASFVYVTVQPDTVAVPVLRTIDTVLTLGEAGRIMNGFCSALEQPPVADDQLHLTLGQCLYWQRKDKGPPRTIDLVAGKEERRRHLRKYAQGAMSPHLSFYFRGPSGALNLRAQNLMLFIQIAEGVDDETWLFHLRRGDYSKWIRGAVKDSELADKLQGIENDPKIDAQESRRRIKDAIEQDYTAPATRT